MSRKTQELSFIIAFGNEAFICETAQSGATTLTTDSEAFQTKTSMSNQACIMILIVALFISLSGGKFVKCLLHFLNIHNNFKTKSQCYDRRNKRGLSSTSFLQQE